MKEWISKIAGLVPEHYELLCGKKASVMLGDKDISEEPIKEEPFEQEEKVYICETCDGTGMVMDMVCYGGLPREKETECPDCEGTGEVYQDTISAVDKEYHAGRKIRNSE